MTICHDSSHSSHVLSTCFTSREGFLLATRENFFSLQFALSFHTLSHIQLLQWNPTNNTRYKRLNKIIIKFCPELNLTQNSCKSQLYSMYTICIYIFTISQLLKFYWILYGSPLVIVFIYKKNNGFVRSFGWCNLGGVRNWKKKIKKINFRI